MNITLALTIVGLHLSLGSKFLNLMIAEGLHVPEMKSQSEIYFWFGISCLALAPLPLLKI